MPSGSDRQAHEAQSSKQLRQSAERFRLTARSVSDDDTGKALVDWADELDARADAMDREGGRLSGSFDRKV